MPTGRNMSIAVNVPPVSEAKEPAEEIRIFEVAQQSQVYQQADRHPRFTLPAYGGPFHEPGNEKVAYRNNGKQEEISAAAFIVEIVRKQGNEHQAGSSATLQKADRTR